MELSRYVFEALRKDEDLTLFRGRDEGDCSQILVLAPTLERPGVKTHNRLAHEYSLKEFLDPAWAARPIAIARHWDRTVLVFEDPGGMPLDG
jgi:hypothetical protein